MLQISPGAPHFEGIVKNCRSSSYNFNMIINEFIDNIIKKCSEIKIKTIIDTDSNKLYELRISDNYEFGFENILENGTSNPFNMTSPFLLTKEAILLVYFGETEIIHSEDLTHFRSLLD